MGAIVRAVAVVPGTPGAELRDVPAPPSLSGGVRVAVREAGVCGTDHDIAEGRYGRAPDGASYLILGHENLGVVREAAPGGGSPAVGTLVVATVRRGCGACRFCAVDRPDFCETGRYTERGIVGAPGFFAEEYVELPRYLVAVPPDLATTAILLEPLSVVEKAIAQGEAILARKGPTPGHPPEKPSTALVAGTGAIGMLASLALRARGYDVVTIDRHGSDTPAAGVLRRVGATHVSVADGLGALGDRRFDLVLEATGSPSLDFGLVDRLDPNAVLVLTGIPDANAPSTTVPGGALLRAMVLGNRAVVGSVNAGREDFERGLRDLAAFEARWPGAAASLLTRRVPLAGAPDLLGHRETGTIKTVLEVGAVPGSSPA